MTSILVFFCDPFTTVNLLALATAIWRLAADYLSSQVVLDLAAQKYNGMFSGTTYCDLLPAPPCARHPHGHTAWWPLDLLQVVWTETHVSCRVGADATRLMLWCNGIPYGLRPYTTVLVAAFCKFEDGEDGGSKDILTFHSSRGSFHPATLLASFPSKLGSRHTPTVRVSPSPAVDLLLSALPRMADDCGCVWEMTYTENVFQYVQCHAFESCRQV